MLFDKTLMLAEDLAFDATGPSIMVGDLLNVVPGPGQGELITIYFTGKNLTTSGGVYIAIDGSMNDADWGEDMTVGIGVQAAQDEGVTFALPSNVSRYIKLRVTGLTAGTMTAGIVLNSLQG